MNISSIGVSTAFLQGMKLDEITTADGEARKACVRPPADIWEFLSPEEYEKALKAGGANSSSWSHLLWNLLRPVYGLKDAPLLWIMNLYKSIGGTVVKVYHDSKAYDVQWTG